MGERRKDGEGMEGAQRGRRAAIKREKPGVADACMLSH